MELTADKVWAVRVYKFENTGITNQQHGLMNPQYRPGATQAVFYYGYDFRYFTEYLYNRNGSKMIAIFKIYPKFDFNINC